MNKIEYEIINPVLVEEHKNCIMSIPEGGTLGFDGEFLYARNFAMVWKKLLTERKFLLQWIINGSVKRKLLQNTEVTAQIKRAYTPGQLQAISSPPPVPPIPSGVPSAEPLLPMVLPVQQS